VKAPCLRKGVIIGRAASAVNELYTQLTVLDIPDKAITEVAFHELKKSLGPLRRNLKSAPEIQMLEAATKKLEKNLYQKSSKEDRKADVKEIQTNFRKAVEAGFKDCGAPGISASDMADLMGDNAYYVEK